ncbi:MAG: Prolyl oligopeptidase [Cyanobacteria bacterium RYN_339]|nr:Prolyl oligopeptidase [Cyanobacteria bacterium RYN_339]
MSLLHDPAAWRLVAGLVCTVGALGLAAGPLEAKPAKPVYPTTPEHPVTDTYFGEQVVDPFRWLEDGDAKDVKAWMKAQNGFTRKTLDTLPLRAGLRKRMLELLGAARQEPPAHRGGHYFFKRQDGSLPQAVLMVQDGLAGKPRRLIDPNPLAKDATVSLDWWSPSLHGETVAYGLSSGGDEQSVLHLIDVKTGKALKETIPGCRYASVAWLADASAFYYTRFPGKGANGEDKQRIYFHTLGDDPAKDPVVFEPGGGSEMICFTQLSKDDRFLLMSINKGSSSTNEVFLLDRQAGGAPKQLVSGFKHYYYGDVHEGVWYVRTDEDAPRGKVFAVPLEQPERANWKLVIPQTEDALQTAFIGGGKLVTEYLHNAASEVRLFSLAGEKLHTIDFKTQGTVSGLSGDGDDPELFFSFTSYLEPATVYRYELAAGALTTFFKPDVHIDHAAYQQDQVWFTSKDGTRVPMFLVHKKGMKRDGQNATLLTAYGGFDISLSPSFSAADFVWIERGGVLAVPNLRGGGEFGSAWHEGGMRAKKQNVFDDFFAAAEWLIKEQVTSPKKLGIEGGSNGGLLMGAAVTQRPDLFQAVVCAVPLLDMLRYHRFLIARYWIPEYGSSEDPAQYAYIKAYSPYQHVRAGTHYPATLVVTGESDTRVDPLHARKMAALLQRDQGGPAPIYLYVESKAGHGAGKPLTKRVETSADTLGFLAWQLGMHKEEKH